MSAQKKNKDNIVIGFPCDAVWMWMLDSKKGREKETRFIRIVVLAQIIKDPMDSQENKPVSAWWDTTMLFPWEHGCQTELFWTHR